MLYGMCNSSIHTWEAQLGMNRGIVVYCCWLDRQLVIVMWDQYFVVITMLEICYALCNCKSVVLP